MSDKIINLAKKLNELAKRGEGGERINADRMLKELMRKHGINMEDIEGKQVSRHLFTVRKEQDKIFFQVASSVLGSNFETWRHRKDSRKVYLETTAANAIEIYAKFDFYWKLWTKDIDVLRYAFFSKHGIFPAGGNVASIDDLTPEQLERLSKAKRMQAGLHDESFRKQISGTV